MIFRRRQDEMEGFRRMREALRQQADPQDHALLDDDQYAPYEDDEDDQVALLADELEPEDEVADLVAPAAGADDGAPPAIPAVASSGFAAAPEASVVPAPAQPAMIQRPEGRPVTVLAADASWSGTLRSESDVYLEGRVEGTLEVRDTVYIAEQAAVNARIKARSVVVAGQLSGSIVCEGRIEVMPTGRVTGDIDVASLIVHEGAVIDGKFRMSNPGAGQAR